jgi:hypothetical protein
MRLIPAVLVLIFAAACSGNDTAATTPTPTVTRTTDTFSGTAPVGGSAFNTFTVAQAGQVDVTLTAAAPPATITMGIGLGAPGDSRCVLFAGAVANTPAGVAPQLSGTVSPATLCVEVHDLGNQTAPVTYTVTVTHP